MPANDRPRRSAGATRKSVEKVKSKKSIESKTEEIVNDNSLDDLIDSSNDSSSGDDEPEAPWHKKRKIEEEKSKKPSTESQSGIPKKKKEEETADDSSNVKSEPSSLIATMAPPTGGGGGGGGGAGPSLIANMKPMQAKQQTIREWKSKDEYKAFKAGKVVNKSVQSISGGSVLPQKREVSPVPTPQSASASPIREQSDIENRIHKDLGLLITYVIDSEGKKASSTQNVTSDPYLNIMHSTEESSNKIDTSKGGIIDWVCNLYVFVPCSFIRELTSNV
jgi:hypothetical protein